MRLAKKIIVACTTLLILSAGAAGLPSQAAVPSIGSDGCYIHEEKAAEIFKSARGRKKVTLPVPVEGITDSTGNYKYIILDDGTAQTVKHLKKGEEKITVPSVLDGYTVTSIGKKTFYKEDSITSVEIPGTVTDIGEQAFEHTGIKGLHIPGSVVSIGKGAFSDCDSPYFTELIIPDQVTALGDGAFAGCSNLRRVELGRGVTAIGNSTFGGCKHLFDLVIYGSIKTIGDRAFCNSGLTKMDIPDGVSEIGDLAFYDCWSLKDITIPKSVIEIGNKAFGYGDSSNERVQGAYITGYRDTAAYHYAKHDLAFRDIETGEVTRFDLMEVPRQKIGILAAGKKKIMLAYKWMEGAAYQVAIRKNGESSWKKYSEPEPSATIKGLEALKQYEVKVRAVREIDGGKYYGKWSKMKKVTVR